MCSHFLQIGLSLCALTFLLLFSASCSLFSRLSAKLLNYYSDVILKTEKNPQVVKHVVKLDFLAVFEKEKSPETLMFQEIFRGWGNGTCAFSGAPRPDVINVGLCRQIARFPSFVRQSVLLPQNGSHPQVPLLCRNNKKIQHINDVLYFLVEATGLEPTTSWSLMQVG